jgi:hypothetical protein
MDKHSFCTLRRRVKAINRPLLFVLCCSFYPLLVQGQSSPARQYLEHALSVMQENYAFRRSIDWSSLRRTAMEQATGAEEPVDTYEAIRVALRTLGDRHSQLILTPELVQAEAQRRTARHLPPIPPPPKVVSPFRERTVAETKIVQEQGPTVALVVVPMFSGPDRSGFATHLQQQIRDVERHAPCGWVVDVRGNRGGTMWPMLAGVGPILGEGLVGEFIDKDGHLSGQWFYHSGRALLDSAIAAEVEGPPVISPMRPVAVLIDGATGSSGEAIAIAFQGRSETRFFGVRTSGAASGPKTYGLSDGARIMLAFVAEADRNGHTYEHGIEPDMPIEYKTDASGPDSQIQSAIAWLGQQRACVSR